MMKEFDEIDRLFQDTFEGYEAMPDPSVKAGVDKALTSTKRKRRFFIWFFPAILAFGFTANYFYSKLDTSKYFAIQSIKGTKSVMNNVSPGLYKKILRKSTYNEENSTVVEASNSDITTLSPNVNEKTKSEAKDFINQFQTVNRNQTEKSSFKNVNRGESGNPLATISEPQSSNVYEKEKNRLTQKSESVKNEMNDHEETIDKDTVDTPKRDSIENEPIVIKIDLAKPKVGNWMLSFYTGFDRLSRNDELPDLETFNPTNQVTNFTSYTSRFYSEKLELSRKLNSNWGVLFGVGYQLNKIENVETKYVLDSVLASPGGVIVSSPPIIYFMSSISENQHFKVSSFVLPLGLLYTNSLTDRVGFGCALGTELYFGKLRQDQIIYQLPKPSFRSFGLNLFLRPELNYQIGKVKIGLYGNINKALREQIIWMDFSNPKPRVGGGLVVHFPIN